MSDTKVCLECAMPIPGEARKCPHCRTSQVRPAAMYRGEGRIVAGVCGAIARRVDVDPVWVRLACALTFLASAGTMFAVYAILWMLIPLAPGLRTPAARMVDSVTRVANASPGTSGGFPERDAR